MSETTTGTTTDNSNLTQGGLAIAAAVLLGIAAVLTAWSAYRESLTSDLVLKSYSEQQATLALANDAYIRSGQERAQEDRKSTRLNSSHIQKSRMPSSA